MEQKLKKLLKPYLFPLAVNPVRYAFVLFNGVNSRGSILILTLWTLLFLSFFSITLSFIVRQKLTLVYRLDERDRLRFIAEAGVNKAISQIKGEAVKTYDTLNDEWSESISAFKEVNIGNAKFSIFYDYSNEQTGLTEPRYGIIDEESKININKARRSVLKTLFRIILDTGEIQAQELAAAIVDWRDTDSALSIPSGSAEDSFYRDLEYSYEAKDEDFEVLEEVLLVKGMDNRIFKEIKNYITIYGDGKVNVHTASTIVLLALGLDQGLVNKIESFRRGEDGFLGTIDDNIFDTPSHIVPKLDAFSHLNDSEKARLTVIADQYLGTTSNNFMVRCVSKLNGKKKSAEVVSVINRGGEILYFQE